MTPRRLAWGLVAVATVPALGGSAVAVAAGVPVGEALELGAGIGLVFSLCLPVLGALIVQRHGSHAFGWLLSLMGVTIAWHAFLDVWSRTALLEAPGSLPGGVVASWIALWLWIPGWFSATTLVPALFPDGRMRRLVRLDALAILAMTLGTAVLSWPLRGIIDDPPADPGPQLGAHLERLQSWYVLELVALASLSVASFASLIRRHRRAGAVERRQFAWVLYGTALACALAAVGAHPDVGSWVQILQALAFVGGLAAAMLWHNLYDIGAVINRTLVYGALTTTVVGVYLVGVLVLQAVLSPGSDLAVAGSTLAAAAVFRPARARIQSAVDRRFHRRRYDVQRTLEAFGSRLRDEAALEVLGAELREVVTETMQPAHVSLWLRPERRA